MYIVFWYCTIQCHFVHERNWYTWYIVVNPCRGANQSRSPNVRDGLVATGSVDRTAHVWRAGTGEHLAVVEGDEEGIMVGRQCKVTLA